MRTRALNKSEITALVYPTIERKALPSPEIARTPCIQFSPVWSWEHSQLEQVNENEKKDKLFA